MPQKTGAHGWPLVPSKRFPGEDTLACPTCKSTNIVMTVRPGPIGYGPGGRWRMGDRDMARWAAACVPALRQGRRGAPDPDRGCARLGMVVPDWVRRLFAPMGTGGQA